MSNDDPVPFTTTAKVRDTCLCLHLQSAARAVGRCFDAAFRPLGLTNGQFSLLMSLNRPEPPSIGAISALLAMDRTTLTANLKPLERRGLLQVTVDPADRRSRRLRLTPSGGALLAAALPVWETTHAEIEWLLIRTDPDDLRCDLRALSAPDAGAAIPDRSALRRVEAR
jgi:DNA-binding MarR family transcriptional regulator